MIITFEDECWSLQDDDWNRSLIEVLILLVSRQQHAVLANPDSMATWCAQHLPLYTEYFKTRLASAIPRTKSLKIKVSPTGAGVVAGDPPWTLTARAAWGRIHPPLRFLMENNNSDRLLVESTIPHFSQWCSLGWIEPVMGGGSAMGTHIATTANDVVERWRTFYMFDSDRLHPSELTVGWTPPSGDGCQGYKFEVLCNGLPRSRWHMLKRRSIENYLPQVILNRINLAATQILFRHSIGSMAYFYNFKKGLAGDGIWPSNPQKAVRSARCQGFWITLPEAERASLKTGFGTNVSNEFQNVPSTHAWPQDVMHEMETLAEALQDAI